MLPDFESSTPGAAFDVMFWPLAPAYPVLLGACSSSDRQNCRAAISLSGYRALQKLQPCNYYLRPSTARRIGLAPSLPGLFQFGAASPVQPITQMLALGVRDLVPIPTPPVAFADRVKPPPPNPK